RRSLGILQIPPSARDSDATGPKSSSSIPTPAMQRNDSDRQDLGKAAETTFKPAALHENAGSTIRLGPTRKQGAVRPDARRTGCTCPVIVFGAAIGWCP